MILWAYFATVTTDPGQVPAGWIPFADEQVRAAIQARESGPPSVQQHLRGPATSNQRSSAHIIVRCAMRSKHGRSWSALLTATTSSVRKGADAPPGCRSADVDSMAKVYPRVMPHAAIALAVSSGFADRRDPRRPRYCKRCQAWKPERAHHCSVSGRCILKMDHYCIWVVNCVGLLNYKVRASHVWFFVPICVTHTLYGARSCAARFVVRTRGWQHLNLVLCVRMPFACSSSCCSCSTPSSAPS